MKNTIFCTLTLLLLFGAVSFASETIVKSDIELVLISAGEFQMGKKEWDYARPVHKVQLASFYLGKYEVTNGQYKKFCDDTKRKYPENPAWDKNYFLSKPNHPVLNVGWYDAVDFAKWAGGRLPTEAEWEHACRAGTSTMFYWGKEEELSHDYLNYRGVSGPDEWKYTAPVGSFPPNSFGVYDMLGNVWEWNADYYRDDYYSNSPMKNPKGPKKGKHRVLKGDAWGTGNIYGCPERWDRQPHKKRQDVGFRIAVDTKHVK